MRKGNLSWQHPFFTHLYFYPCFVSYIMSFSQGCPCVSQQQTKENKLMENHHWSWTNSTCLGGLFRGHLNVGRDEWNSGRSHGFQSKCYLKNQTLCCGQRYSRLGGVQSVLGRLGTKWERKCLGVVGSGGGLVVEFKACRVPWRLDAQSLQESKLQHYWVYYVFLWAYYFWEQSTFFLNYMGTVVILFPSWGLVLQGLRFPNSLLSFVEVCPGTFVIGYSLSDNPRDITTLLQWNIEIKGLVNRAPCLIAFEIKRPNFSHLKYESFQG